MERSGAAEILVLLSNIRYRCNINLTMPCQRVFQSQPSRMGCGNAVDYVLNPACAGRRSASFSSMEQQVTTTAKFSVFAIIAIVAAILSFATGAVLGLVFALIAILFGVIAMISASRASVRGGFTGMLAFLAGTLGIVAAVVKAVMWFF